MALFTDDLLNFSEILRNIEDVNMIANDVTISHLRSLPFDLDERVGNADDRHIKRRARSWKRKKNG